MSITLAFTSYARDTYLGIFIFMEFVKCISRRELREQNVGVHLVRPSHAPTLGYSYSWRLVKAFQGVSRTLTFTSYACNTFLGIFIFMEFGKCIHRREWNADVHLVRTHHIPWDIHIHGVW